MDIIPSSLPTDQKNPSGMAETMASTSNDAPHGVSTDSMEKKSTHAERRNDGKSANRAHTRGNSRRNAHKRPDMGRAEWSRNPVDKRARNEETQEAVKRRKLNNEDDQIPIYATQFSKEEIESEGRRPKKKVAVMIGYSGSGYKGMQLNHRVRTIEGDLFTAFVAARAISKANGDDPKKSSLIRCARTDKGVHAAANLISLKLIIEDPDIVQKINEKLSPQIRVFNIQRTNGAFSAYQSCDSRIYEYLIPTHAFLPPHPKSFLGKKLEELAEEADDIEGYRSRQCEVSTFWEETEERYIKPILEQLDHSIRSQVIEALYKSESGTLETDIKSKNPDEIEQTNDTSSNLEIKCRVDLDGSRADKPTQQATIFETEDADQQNVGKNIGDVKNLDITNTIQHTQEGIVQSENSTEDPQSTTEKASALDQAIKSLRAAYIHAKNAYRIDAARLARVRSVLSLFVGSHNYHNYTIQKRFQDPSAKRVIKSFVVHNDAPLVAPGGGEEWLSLKVHGQSFMMHQIRKMVGMAALVVRCGCPETRLQDSYLGSRISIPKAPGLGLLLERPVFDVYNKNQARQPQQHQQQQVERVNIDFGRFDDVITEFKQREIYDRIFREEERDHQFHAFFASIDNLASSRLLHLSSVGISATTRAVPSDTGFELGIGREVGALIDGSEEDEVEGGDGDGG